jgi:hypothetical protein
LQRIISKIGRRAISNVFVNIDLELWLPPDLLLNATMVSRFELSHSVMFFPQRKVDKPVHHPNALKHTCSSSMLAASGSPSDTLATIVVFTMTL